ncbi:hypothetical protein DFH06DRAFT_1237596 [Mycena polygramma]|nr:hypothetical protein DFH06DRAFT_1237596 [Mycena polygramma]
MVTARLLLPMGCEIRLSWFLSGSLVPSAFAALMATTDRHRISAHGLFFFAENSLQYHVSLFHCNPLFLVCISLHTR